MNRSVFELPFSEGVGEVGTIALDAIQGPEDERTTHAEVHNLFGYGMARASYEGQRRYRNNERPFTLTRSGYAGVQRWSACWMGDNHSWWEHLEMAMPQLLIWAYRACLSSEPILEASLVMPAASYSPVGCNSGAFSPTFCRAHSEINTESHEPWVFGHRLRILVANSCNYVTGFFPLFTFWEASLRGIPVLRPLLYHFPDDPI